MRRTPASRRTLVAAALAASVAVLLASCVRPLLSRLDESEESGTGGGGCTVTLPASLGAMSTHSRSAGYYPIVGCEAGRGDASGTLALPITWRMLYGVHEYAFTTNTGSVLGRTQAMGLRLLAQPSGFTGLGGYGPSNEAWVTGIRHDGSEASTSDVFYGYAAAVQAANPWGGVVVGGRLSPSREDPPRNALWSFTQWGVPRWGPTPIASSGAIVGLGVNLVGHVLVLTDGSSAFGQGALSAQWFDQEGYALTEEFLASSGALLTGDVSFEFSPLRDGGLALRRIESHFAEASSWNTSTWVLVFPMDIPSAVDAPPWLSSRPNTRMQLVLQERAYAFLPEGAPGVACSQRVEVVEDGISCGSLDFPIDSGTCDTSAITVGKDGTVIQLLPTALESDTLHPPCTWRLWPALLR